MENQPEWNYEAWNQDHGREATDTEIEWMGWKRPTWSDEMLKQGEIPKLLSDAILEIQAQGGTGNITMELPNQAGHTIEIKIEYV